MSHSQSILLDPTGFDPIFTREFFKLPEQTAANFYPVNFPMWIKDTPNEFANGLENFLKSAEGAQYKTGVKTIVGSITTTVRSWDIQGKETWITQLERFLKIRFTDYEGKDVEVNKTYQVLFTESVVDFNNIAHKIKDESLPLSLRQNVIRNLLEKDELERCGPGIANFIKDTHLQLTINPEEVLMAARREEVIQIANNIHRTLDQHNADHILGMEIHYAHFVAFSYAHVLGLKKESYDFYFQNLQPHKVQALFERVVTDLPRLFNLQNIIENHLLKRFDLLAIIQDVKKKRDELSQSADLIEQMAAYFNKKTQGLEESLKQYGIDENWTAGSLFQIDLEKNPIELELQQNAYQNLESTLVHRLFSSGYLNKEQRIEIKLPDEKKKIEITLPNQQKRTRQIITPGNTIYILGDEKNLCLSYIGGNQSQKNDLFFPHKKKVFIEILLDQLADQSLMPLKRKTIERLLSLKEISSSLEEDETLFLKAIQQRIIPLSRKTIITTTSIDNSRAFYNIGAIEYHSCSLLDQAVSRKYLSVVKYLINENLFSLNLVTFSEGEGYTYTSSPLDFGIRDEKPNIEIAKFLIDAYLQHEISLRTVFDGTYEKGILARSRIRRIIQLNHLEIIKYLFEKESSYLEDKKSSILIEIIHACNLDILKYLIIEKGISVNETIKDLQMDESFFSCVSNNLVFSRIKDRTLLSYLLLSRPFPFSNVEQEATRRNAAIPLVDFLLVSGARIDNADIREDEALYQREPKRKLLNAKLKAFQKIPEPRPNEEKTAREKYLRQLRERTLVAYEKEENTNLAQRTELEVELKEFHQLEQELTAFKDKIAPSRANQNLKGSIEATDAAIENSYAQLAQKKKASEIVQVLKQQATQARIYSEILPASSSLHFFGGDSSSGSSHLKRVAEAGSWASTVVSETQPSSSASCSFSSSSSSSSSSFSGVSNVNQLSRLLKDASETKEDEDQPLDNSKKCKIN